VGRAIGGTGGRRRPLGWLSVPAVALVAGMVLDACGGGGANTITLYNGQHPQLTGALVTAFEQQTGIHVRVRTDDGIVLADELLQEGRRSPADVYLTENSPELMLLTEHHLLAKLPGAITGQVPSAYDSPTANWVGIATRVSTLAYNPSLVSASQLPAHLLDLAQPQWKGKVAVAPTDSDFVPLVGAVISRYGSAGARNWLSGLKANSSVYQDDEAVVAAVERGQASVGIINQYYWYRLQLEQGAARTHSRLYFFPGHDVGSVQNVAGAAVLSTSTHMRAAQAFLSFLVSARGQAILAAGDDFEYPARPGVPANPALEPLSQIDPATISVVSLGDDQAAASLLQQTGLT
jgi:iron(III) transport system substrate-binding protein